MLREKYSFTFTILRLIQPGGIEALGKIFVSVEVSKIRLNSGEPMVSKDVGEIIGCWLWHRDNDNFR
jgi:molybdenum cofactor biosynthesis enzyme MoaA